jgi:CRISPR-associated protein Csm5
MSENIRLRLTTLSPLTIGNGMEYSPYRDYVVKNGQILMINNKAVEQKMIVNDKFMNEYIEGVANMEGNRSKFDLKWFLENNLQFNINEIITLSIPLISRKPSSKLPIRATIKTPREQPYIPGSGIKGALKTALLYDWLNKEEKGKQWLNTFLNKCRSIEYWYREKDLTKLFGDHYNNLEKQLETYTCNETTGETRLAVCDTEPFAKDSLVAFDCNRKIPLRFEGIHKNAVTQLSLVSVDYTWNTLAQKINAYTFNTTCQELSLVEENDKEQVYTDFLKRMCGLVDNAYENPARGIAYLRLGFGKGYYTNSIGEALINIVSESEEKRKSLNKYFQAQFTRKSKKEGREYWTEVDIDSFPKTRLKVDSTQEGLGWVKLERIE